MATNDEERALRSAATLHDVVEDLRALLTAAVVAQLQVRPVVDDDTERKS